MRTFTGMAVAPRCLRLCVAILLLAAGCKSKALQELDGSGGGIGGIDACGRGARRRPWPTAAALDGRGRRGRRSAGAGRAVRGTAIVRRDVEVCSDGGATSVTSHVFTMTLDADQRIGHHRRAGRRRRQARRADRRRWVAPRRHARLRCPRLGRLRRLGAVRRSQLRDRRVRRHCRATGRGHTDDLRRQRRHERPGDDDAGGRSRRRAADLEPVGRRRSRRSVDAALGRRVRAAARSSRCAGAPIDERGRHRRSRLSRTAGPVRDRVRRSRRACFASATNIASRFDGITDLAGNAPPPAARPPSPPAPPPPLVAADGFESVTDATLGGAQVLSGAGAPVITGARSLYIPPGDSLGHGRRSRSSRCACRSRRATRSSASPTGPSTPATRPTSTIVVAASGGHDRDGDACRADVGGRDDAGDDRSDTRSRSARSQTATIAPARRRAYGEVVARAAIASQTDGSCGGPAPRPVPG